jgi:hypothetical protein
VNPGVASWLPTALFVPLVAFALYRRLRRTFGPQPITPKRMALRMILLCVVSIGFLASMPTAVGFAAAVVGTSLGIILAAYGLKHTQFDVTPAARSYTPNPWIGLVVTALFLGRLAARMFSVYEARTVAASGNSPAAGFQRSPLTLGIFFLMATYYVAYYAGVLRKGRTVGVP